MKTNSWTTAGQAKDISYRQAPTNWLNFYGGAVIESEAQTAVVQLKSEA